MLLEPGMNCQDVSSDQVSVASSNHCNAIVTHASDSDTSDGLLPSSTSFTKTTSPGMMPLTVAKSRDSAVAAAASVYHSQRPPSGNMNRFASHSPPESPPTSTRTSGGGFFIEI